MKKNEKEIVEVDGPVEFEENVDDIFDDIEDDTSSE